MTISPSGPAIKTIRKERSKIYLLKEIRILWLWLPASNATLELDKYNRGQFNHVALTREPL
jgi:hypothetical protein